MQSASHGLYFINGIVLLKLHALAVATLCSSQCHHLSENGDENEAMCRYGIGLFLCTHKLLGMHFWAGSMPWCFKNIQELLPSWALINICPTMNLLNVIQVRWAKTSQISDSSRNILSEKKKLLFSICGGLHCLVFSYLKKRCFFESDLFLLPLCPKLDFRTFICQTALQSIIILKKLNSSSAAWTNHPRKPSCDSGSVNSRWGY